MDNQLIRLVILMVLVIMLTSDVKDLMQVLSTASSASVGPLFSWLKPQEGVNAKSSRSKRSVPLSNEVEVEDDEPMQFYTPIPTGRSRSQTTLRLDNNAIGSRNTDGAEEEGDNENQGGFIPGNFIKNLKSKSEGIGKEKASLLSVLTEEEKSELIALKSHITKVMQEWCLPKLVCELHASVGERDSLSDAEKGLLSIIKETSMNPMGEVISRYHFAAHMGQLLANVEGNGCHNFYPNCPLSGNKVLQMVKKVRIR